MKLVNNIACSLVVCVFSTSQFLIQTQRLFEEIYEIPSFFFFFCITLDTGPKRPLRLELMDAKV